MATLELTHTIGGYDWEGLTRVYYKTEYDPVKNQTTVTFSESDFYYRGLSGYDTSATAKITVTAVDNSESSKTATMSTSNRTDGGYDRFPATPSPKTVTVQHGTSTVAKSVQISCSSTIKVYVGTSNQTTTKKSGSVTVKTGESKASGLIASRGTLGEHQTLTVDRAVDSFTHTIAYSCGTAIGTICTKSSAANIGWTPPLSLASQNTRGKSVTIQYTINTYTGDTLIGVKVVSVVYDIPISTSPTFTVSISDATGNADKFGGFVQSKSKLKIVLDITTQYGASVQQAQIDANYETHYGSDITTGFLKNSGDNPIVIKVTDSRGWVTVQNLGVPVLAYSDPSISLFTHERCDSDGTDNPAGENVKITFSNAVTSLNGNNAANYKLEYKKIAASTYTAVNMDSFAGFYSVTKGTWIFPADAGSSYNVRLTVTDSFGSAVATLLVDTGFAIMHWLPKGLGMAIGKIAEKLHTLELGWKIHMNGNRIEGLGNPVDDADAVPLKVARGFHARNLLDNSDFSNPVNQRGQESYLAETGYAIDRWRHTNKLDVTLQDGYINLTCTSETGANGFTQYLGNIPAAGTPVTLAAMENDGTLHVGSVNMPSSGNAVAFSVSSRITGRVYPDRVSFLIGIGKSIDLKWAALYAGEYTAETLPEYQPKDYAEELLTCERYFRVLRNANGYVSASNAYIFAPYNMRTTPTATVVDIGTVRTQGKSVTPTSVSEVTKYIGDGIRLTMPGEYGSSNYAATLFNAKIWLSADL